MNEERKLLFDLLNSYSPTWHYEMGKVGYACNFCGCVIRSSSDFHKPEFHRRDCAYISANTLRFAAVTESR